MPLFCYHVQPGFVFSRTSPPKARGSEAIAEEGLANAVSAGTRRVCRVGPGSQSRAAAMAKERRAIAEAVERLEIWKVSKDF